MRNIERTTATRWQAEQAARPMCAPIASINPEQGHDKKQVGNTVTISVL